MVGDLPIRVWIVEDNVAFRRSVGRAIDRSEGMRCDAQFDTAEAVLTSLKTSRNPDVILFDVQLPGISGIDAISEIANVDKPPRTVLLTVFDDEDAIFRAICAGASGYLLKTSGIAEIAEAVQVSARGESPMTPLVAKRVLELFVKSDKSLRFRDGNAEQYHLTEREHDILKLMADGLIKKEIADRLDISVHTVSTYLRSIYEKLHVRTNTAAVAKAVREGLV